MGFKVVVNWTGRDQWKAEKNAIMHDTIDSALIDVRNALDISRHSTTSRKKAIITVQEVED